MLTLFLPFALLLPFQASKPAGSAAPRGATDIPTQSPPLPFGRIFPSVAYWTTGVGPKCLVLADLDSDQVDDLLVAGGDDEVLVRYGSPDGTFGPESTLAMGVFVDAVAVADLDGNGVPDVACASGDSGSVVVRLGLGGGSFSVPSSYSTGQDPRSLAFGDLDGDSLLDVVVASHDSDDVSVLIGNGLGGFVSAVSYPAGDGPASVIAADLDGNDVLDLAVATTGGGGPADGQVLVLMGTGDGTFGAPSSIGEGEEPWALAGADLNGDGVLDLVCADAGWGGLGGAALVFLGLGDGTFTARSTFWAGHVPLSVAVDDLDADGAPDLVVASDFDLYGALPAGLHVLLGSGDGGFEPSTMVGSIHGRLSVVTGDLDGDGAPDLVTGSDGANVSVFFGSGDGSFSVATEVAAGVGWDLTVDDLDDDGAADLAVASNSSVGVFLGNGRGEFGPPQTFSVNSGTRHVESADLDNDGLSDLIVANGSALSVLLGMGGGSFGPVTDLAAGLDSVQVAVGDLDDDGALDLVAASGTGSKVKVLLGIGDGSFSPPVEYEAGKRPHFVQIADLDNDGVLDVAAVNAVYDDAFPWGGVSILLGVGDGTLGPPTRYLAGFEPVDSVAVEDFDNDGFLDLVVANGAAFPSLSVFRGVGDGTFVAGTAVEGVPRPSGVDAHDFDGDGRVDIVYESVVDDGVVILPGAGDGTFGPPSLFREGEDIISFAVGDLNDDGEPDITASYWPLAYPSYLTVFINRR